MAETCIPASSSKLSRHGLAPFWLSVLVAVAWFAFVAVLVAAARPASVARARAVYTAGPASVRQRCGHRRIHTASLRGVVRITTIRNGATVPRVVDPLRGTYRNVARGSRLWIFVWSPIARRFYPQTHDPEQPAVLRNGRFRSAAFFGGRSGEHYEVLAALATARASRVISRTLHAWRVRNDFRGWAAKEVPAGVEEKHCVEVVLR